MWASNFTLHLHFLARVVKFSHYLLIILGHQIYVIFFMVWLKGHWTFLAIYTSVLTTFVQFSAWGLTKERWNCDCPLIVIFQISTYFLVKRAPCGRLKGHCSIHAIQMSICIFKLKVIIHLQHYGNTIWFYTILIFFTCFAVNNATVFKIIRF